jgi:predicted glycosyltransferase
MACECNVMGVHSIFTSELTSGAGDELEKKYGLMYVVDDRENMVQKSIKKIDELLGDKDLQKKGKEKLKKLLKEKVEINQWFVDYLEQEVAK